MLEIKIPKKPRPPLDIHIAHLAVRRPTGERVLVTRNPGTSEGDPRAVLFFDGASWTYGNDSYYNEEFDYVESKPWREVKVVY